MLACFPERAGPMVLDNMNFSRSIHEASIASKQGRPPRSNEFIAPMQPGMTTGWAWAPMPPPVKANLQSVGRQVTER